MTDARLAAAVEAAARARFEESRRMWPDRKTWENVGQGSRDGWIESIEVYLIEAALAAADAWDREHGVVRVCISATDPVESLPTLEGWLLTDDDPDEPREPRPVPR